MVLNAYKIVFDDKEWENEKSFFDTDDLKYI
jgi:hypothetical protein